MGVPLHIVTNSELVFLGLKGKCEKWKRHKCLICGVNVGSLAAIGG